jgi:hypothetical protein
MYAGVVLLPRVRPGIAVLPTVALPHVTIPRAAVWMLVLGLVAAIPHALNMFGYPAFTLADDEGIYASQAITWLRTGALAPNVYSYDHAPGGWIQLAIFYALTGGPSTFGTPIDGGRVLMLIFHIASTLLLYRLTRRLGGSVLAATTAAVMFSLSPLALFYQRLVLLDNVMMFWLLASMVLALEARSRVWLGLSGIVFGVALLSKEVAIVLAPVIVAIAWRRGGWRGILIWCGAVVFAVLPYPLYAFSRGELWPVPDPYLPYVEPNEMAARPSLLSTLFWQLGRPGGGPFSLRNSFFRYLREDWLWRDPAILVLGVTAIVINAARGARSRLLLVAEAAALPSLYLARGGVTFSFYIVLAIPFLALNIGIALDPVFRRLSPARALRLAGSLLILLLGTYWWGGPLQPLYVERADGPGREAQAWIKTHVPATSVIVGGDDMLAYLREPQDGPAFAGYQEHWKVANDPAVHQQLYDWTRIDYLVINPYELADFYRTENWLALSALAHAHQVAAWTFVNSAARPFHRDQRIEIWEADRLSDPNLAAFSAAMFHGRDQVCAPRVASCDDVIARPRRAEDDAARAPEPVRPP